MKTFLLTVAAALALGVNADVCGATGNAYLSAYYYNDSDDQGNYDTCSQLCLADSSCKSMAVNGTACEMFHALVAGHFVQDDSASFTFYDRTCLTGSSASNATIPPGCEDQIATSLTVVNFNWHNTTHNCDCAASRPDVGDGTGCLDDKGQWCDPNTQANCTHCGTGVCLTGLPSQPIGYGPPDIVNFDLDTGHACTQSNPQGFKPREVGEGNMYCGGRYPAMAFTSSSERAVSSGVFSYGDVVYCGGTDSQGNTLSWYKYYDATFPVNCEHDAQRNATCTTPQPFDMPLKSVTLGAP